MPPDEGAHFSQVVGLAGRPLARTAATAKKHNCVPGGGGYSRASKNAVTVEGKILVHQFLAPGKPENKGKLNTTTEQQQKTPQNTEQHNKQIKKTTTFQK